MRRKRRKIRGRWSEKSRSALKREKERERRGKKRLQKED